MRVLFLTTNPNRLSTTVSLEGWFQALRPAGLTPVLVSDQAGEFHAWARQRGIASYAIPLPFPRKARPVRFVRSLAALVGVAKRHRIELVHCNEQAAYPIG